MQDSNQGGMKKAMPSGIITSAGGLGGFGGSVSNTNPITGASIGSPAEAGEYCNNSTSVREYSYQENKNRRFRPQMEDTHCIVDKLAGDETCGLFAIFDGHGGR